MDQLVLPAARMEYYYAPAHPEYKPLPKGRLGIDEQPMNMIYPEQGAQVLIPLQFDGTYTRIVLHAAHRDPQASINWDLDGTFIGRTTGDHKLPADPATGTHRLTLTDQLGRTLITHFQCTRGTAGRANGSIAP